MSSIEVRPIELPGDAKVFVKSWWPIYRDDPHWVPPLISERLAFFDPAKNPYFKMARIQCFMAFQEGQPVGTIAATVDLELQKNEPGVGLFGFFEFIDDEAVARALWAAASGWLGEQGMTVARGPFNFNSNHEFGLLVDGFDTDPCIANPHNRDYYAPIYESLGMSKVMDWYAYWVPIGPVPSIVQRLSDRVLRRHPEVEIRTFKKSEFEQAVQAFRDIYNDAWEPNWGHIYSTEEEFRFTAENLKQVIDVDLCYFAYIGDECVAASVSLPDYNQVVKKMNGTIFPFGWWHFLTGRKSIDAIRIFILGVKREYQSWGLGAPLYQATWQYAQSMNIRGAEASLILENNQSMRGALEKQGGQIYKTYRSYEVSTAAAP